MADIKRLAQLDFILDHVKNDNRPYLEVSVPGRMLGLFDSGCSRTVLGIKGWNLLKSCCRLNPLVRTNCVVANDQTCRSIGVVEVPYHLRDKVITLKTMVVPDLPHSLILGVDF